MPHPGNEKELVESIDPQWINSIKKRWDWARDFFCMGDISVTPEELAQIADERS